MKPVILFRKDLSSEDEFEIAKQYFTTVEYRTDIPHNSLVICRYSALPYYNELEHDIKNIGSTLINSYSEHNWISDFTYYEDLKEYTPRSWFEWEFPYCNHEGPFVLKGRTNSRKQQWSTHMFAKTKFEAIQVASHLANDPLIGPQGIIYREYVPLKKISESLISGLPFTNEWRFFYYKQNLLAYDYYWSTSDTREGANMTTQGIDFANKVANIASQHTNFFVLDIAETEKGDWILIEVNDGQMSGLSEIDPKNLYENLARNFND